MKRLLLFFVVSALTSSRAASAQTYDFATCDPAVTKITPCSTTTTRCCYVDTAPGSSFNQSGSDYALVIPMDSCHQGGTADDGGKYPGATASSFWCRKPTNAGQIFKVYGLMYRMMQAGIPAYWIINPSKDPPAVGCTNPGSCRQIATDVDMWIMDAAATTPPGATTDLSNSPASTFIKRWTLSSSGTFAADATWTYDKKQFPIRASAFVISAQDRANFNKFVRRQAPYDKWAANPVRSCGNGTSCQDFSGIDFFEIQPTASIGYTHFLSNPTATPGSTAYQAGRMPIAAKLSYTPPRVANRPGPSGVSKKWLEKANLKDDADAGCGGSTAFTPSDAILCDLTQAEIIAGNLKTKKFGWLWLDHKAPSCGAELSAIQDFLTATSTTAAGNVMAIADGTSNESCANQQLLGKQQATAGIDTPNGNAPGKYIYRYPANMMSQWGNDSADFANGLGGGGFTVTGGTFGYHPSFTGANNSLHRLVTVDVGTNGYCPYNKSVGVCDSLGGAGETEDLAMYGRYLNGASNGIVYYLPGTQIHNTTPELKMLLDSLLAIPLGTINPTTSTIEVTRSAPVAAIISNQNALVQGSYEITTPATPVSAMNDDASASAFTFPSTKGHLRAVTANTGLSSTFASVSELFDAADHIPAVTAGGCSQHFTSSCRTVFTTTAAGVRPTPRYLDTQSSTVSLLGPIMGAGLSTSSRSTLISRVLAGTYDGSSYVPKLGGIDRSTAAVIEESPVTGNSRPMMAYVGGADGMLHAICASTMSGTGCDVVGRELWAYIPRTMLPYLRYNTARVDGSPAVRDAFGDFDGNGTREWRTVLIFQTGMGDPSDQHRLPAVYALDITDPGSPAVLWEYSLENASSRGTYELGQGLTIAAGVIMVNGRRKEVVFAQTNNGGTGGAGSVVTAIDLETGGELWATPNVGYTYAVPPRAVGGANSIPAGGIPGGAVAVDKTGSGLITDIVYADLYGNVWMLDPVTGANRYGTNPLFSFSTNYHAIGAKPAIYSSGGNQYAVFVSGGFADPSDTNWGSGVQQYVVSVSLDTPPSAAPLDENSTANIGFKYTLGSSSEKGYAQVLVVGNQIFVTTDSADVNSSTYGTSGTSTGKLYTLSFSGAGSSTNLVNGASSAVRSDTGVYAGSGTTLQYATSATLGGTGVDPGVLPRVIRRLWVRTQ